MIPELGHLALILALCVALAQGLLPLAGASSGRLAWMALARPAALAQASLVLFSFCCLIQAFVANDFSVLYVAEHSNSRLPLQYRVAAAWGGHEGSILLWAVMLGAWGTAVAVLSRRLPERIVARVLGIMGLINSGFYVFILFASNPFERLLPAAEDGRDLNPLLQDPGMVFHPPLLYLGYVGFSVAFAFAIAALIEGRLDAAWARWSRPWTIAAWSFLTLGIALGSGWAYYELGWGGWWFWDPVENASFMPWLVGTALMHSLSVAEKRGSFRAWTVFLAIAAFCLSLLGTFLVRSGVLTSVHAFATDPRRGIYILCLLTLVAGGSLLLFATRAHKIGLGGNFSAVSREAALLGNNVLLSVCAAAVMLGTLYPLALDALNLGKISVGPPYFESVFVPLVTPLLLLMGAGSVLRWKEDTFRAMVSRLTWPAFAAVVAGIAIPLLLGQWTALIALGILLAVWLLGACLSSLLERRRLAGGLRTLPRAYLGMLLAHAGVAVFVLGVTVSRGYESSTDVRMRVGDSASIAGYTLVLRSLEQSTGANYTSMKAHMDLAKAGAPLGSLVPEKRFYPVQNMPMTEAAIDAGFLRHVYVSLNESLEDGSWTLRLQHKPLVGWIWGGCLLMALGGALAAMDRRYRTAPRAAGAAVSTSERAAA